MQTKQEGQCLSELIEKTSYILHSGLKTIDLEFRDTQILYCYPEVLE